MTTLLNFFPLLLAIGCYIAAGLLAKDSGAHDGLLLLAGSLTGLVLSRLGDWSKGAAKPVVGLVLGLSIGGASFVALPACHNIPADRFYNAVVDCASYNPQKSAALAQFETCVASLLAQNPAACLAGVVTDVHFLVDEVACMAAFVAQETNGKVSTGTANDTDLQARRAAIDFLVKEKIAVRNSYSPGR